jgi:hypothetical protein
MVARQGAELDLRSSIPRRETAAPPPKAVTTTSEEAT